MARGTRGRSPGLRQRSQGSWQVTVYTGRLDRDGRYERIIETVRGTKRQAEQRRAELLAAVAQGQQFKPSSETVEEFVNRWLATETGLKPQSVHRYRNALKYDVLPVIGHMRMSAVDSGHLAQVFARSHNRGLTQSSVLFIRSVAKRVFRRAVMWRVIQSSPFEVMESDKRQPRKTRVLDERDLAALAEELDALPQHAAYRLLIHTGMRIGEVLGLRWRDVNFDEARITVAQQLSQDNKFEETKSHRSARPIDIDRTLVAVLRAHRVSQNEARLRAGSQWRNLDLVVCDELGQPLNRPRIRLPFHNAVAKLGLDPELRIHDLRHTHASHLLAQGADLKVVQERLGHSSPSFTLERYGHSLPGRQRQAAERFASILGGEA